MSIILRVALYLQNTFKITIDFERAYIYFVKNILSKSFKKFCLKKYDVIKGSKHHLNVLSSLLFFKIQA
jgi:hypothetical protein